MKANRLVIATFFVALIIALSSPATADWDATFSNGYGDYAYDVQQTADGGYIIAGSTVLAGRGGWSDAWLIKTDSNGNELWNSTFGEDGDWLGDYARSVLQTPDGGYIFVGTKFTPDEPEAGLWYNYAWLLKTGSDGTLQWQRTFRKPDHLYFGFSFQQTTDGGYIIAGSNWDVSTQQTKDYVLLIKTNAFGIEQWTRTFTEVEETGSAISVQQTSDGGYIILGYLGWLIKTDENGAIEWEQQIERGAHCMQKTTDGGYIFAGEAPSGTGDVDMWLMKIDSNFIQQWNQTYGGAEKDSANSVQQTTDGGYILAGTTFEAGSTDMWLVKTDADGNELWNRPFGGEQWERCNSVQQTADDGYIMAGNIDSRGGIWLVKVDGSGCTTYCRDADGDLYGDASDSQCLETPSFPYTTLWDGDCDDNDPNVKPGMAESVCNGKDDDCDPSTPDDVNADGDPVSVCQGDCDDSNPDRYPGNPEVCDDGIDNDCDTLIDSNDPDCSFLTSIHCLYPPNGSVLYAPPTFTWHANGGADNRFAVDLTYDWTFSSYWSTYENMRRLKAKESWAMPQQLWGYIPSGTYVYWRVRGADVRYDPPIIVTGSDVWWFYKW